MATLTKSNSAHCLAHELVRCLRRLIESGALQGDLAACSCSLQKQDSDGDGMPKLTLDQVAALSQADTESGWRRSRGLDFSVVDFNNMCGG